MTPQTDRTLWATGWAVCSKADLRPAEAGGQKPLAREKQMGPSLGMPLPSQPVTLSVEQIAELSRKLSIARHDINNNLSLIMAAVELMRCKPEMGERMMATLTEQPSRIEKALKAFSSEFESTLSITRP
jgi:hypothetical protein